MTKIALFGGTFDPIHVGHLMMAQMALEKMKLDRVIFIPSHIPPHKTSKRLFTVQERFEMTCLAVQHHPCFDVSDYEYKKEGKSFSVDTVEHYYELFGKSAKLYFIIGEDALPSLDQWKDIDQICQMIDFICVNRPGYDAEDHPRVRYTLTTQGIDVSSTQIRLRIKQGKSIQYLVPDSVLRYIEHRNLIKR